jgi:NADH-quinone oxidoreductase subunit H
LTKEWADALIGGDAGIGVFIGVALGACVVVLGFIVVVVMFATWLERKISAHLQSRVGPMRVGGWHGWAQPIADVLKLLLKEDIVPAKADPILFKLAPYIVFTAAFMGYAALAWGSSATVADLNIGIFYILAITSFEVVGILMAGWASNNKWSLLGAMRGVAQVVSYELPAALSIIAVVMWVGSLRLGEFDQSQAGWFWNWHVIKGFPFFTIGTVVFFISSLAETNRLPFDLPEGESELVAGFHTEYTGIRFAMFFLAEYAAMFLVCGVTTLAFLGGGHIGIPMLDAYIPGWIVFVGKSLFLVCVMMWLRWTLPRLRVDQLTQLCWKYLIPIAFFNLIGIGVLMLVTGKA